MTNAGKRYLLSVILVVAALAGLAVVFRDHIAGMILRGGDVSLTGEPARDSPQARRALEFLGALRASDLKAMTQLATAEQADRLQREGANPTPDFENAKAAMLADLPADPAELRGRIKSVQTHGERGAVTFETKANSWFVTLEQVQGDWRVSGF